MLRLKCRFHIKLLSICTLFSQDGHDGGQSNKNGETGHADAVHDDGALVEGRGPPPAAVHVVVAPLSSPSVGRWRQILSTPSACSAESVSGPIPGHVKRIIAVEKEEAEKGKRTRVVGLGNVSNPLSCHCFLPLLLSSLQDIIDFPAEWRVAEALENEIAGRMDEGTKLRDRGKPLRLPPFAASSIILSQEPRSPALVERDKGKFRPWPVGREITSAQDILADYAVSSPHSGNWASRQITVYSPRAL